MLVLGEEELVGTVGGGEWERRVIVEALQALADGQPRTFRAHLTRDLGMCCGGEMEVFLEPLNTRERLHIFGAGHVGQALYRQAALLDFEIAVYDEREEWLSEDRFPDCERVAGDPRKKIPELGPRDRVVILTHSHQLDQALVESILPLPAGYVGMIGSRTKVTRFLIRLRAAGFEEEILQRLCAPLGLDLGGETPEEIALSIAADLIRVRRGSRQPPLAWREQVLPARGGAGLAWPPALPPQSES